MVAYNPFYWSGSYWYCVAYERASSMKKFICMPMTRWRLPAGAWDAISFFTTSADRIRRLTARPPMRSISAGFLNPGQPDLNQAELHLKMRVSVQHPGTSALIEQTCTHPRVHVAAIKYRPDKKMTDYNTWWLAFS